MILRRGRQTLYNAPMRFLIATAMFCLAASLGAAELELYGLPHAFTDDKGRTVRLSEWRGKPVILTMEYANCRFICSITLQRMKDIQDAADRRGKAMDFLIVSIDPENDTPQAWTLYRKNRGLNRDNWHFLTAGVKETRSFASLLGIKYWYYDEHLMHDFRIIRLDNEGRVVKMLDAFDAKPDELLQ